MPPPPPPYLRPGVIPLRPLTLGELLDGAVSIIRRYPRPTLGVSAVVALVTTLVNVLLLLGMDFDALAQDLRNGADAQGPSFTFGTGGGGTSVLAWPVRIIAGLVLTGALTVVVGKAVLGRQTTFAEVWSDLRPRLLPLLGLVLLTTLIAAAPGAVGVLAAVGLVAAAGGAGAVLGVPLAVAGVAGSAYLYVRLSLAPAVLVLERSRIRVALRRSGVLVKGSWWRILGVLGLAAVAAALVAAVIQVPLSVLGVVWILTSKASADSVRFFFLLSQVGSGLASVLVAPFSAGVGALLYVDRRMRAEGLDLTLQAAASQA